MKNLSDTRLAATITRAEDMLAHYSAQPRSIFIAGQMASYRDLLRKLHREEVRRDRTDYHYDVDAADHGMEI